MIRRLKLKNFKRHEDADFHFTEGLNGVFGKNYTGKTSMLYGILYALGGASCVPGTRIATRGASAGMVVELWLSVKGTEYYIKRTKSTCNLHQGDELIASGTTGVNEKIEEILGISMRRFRQLRYVEQKKSHASLAMGAAELHTLLDELTGMDTLTSATANSDESSIPIRRRIMIATVTPVEAINTGRSPLNPSLLLFRSLDYQS